MTLNALRAAPVPHLAPQGYACLRFGANHRLVFYVGERLVAHTVVTLLNG